MLFRTSVRWSLQHDVPATYTHTAPSQYIYSHTTSPRDHTATTEKFTFPATSWFYCCETCVATDFHIVTADCISLGMGWFVVASKPVTDNRWQFHITGPGGASIVSYIHHCDCHFQSTQNGFCPLRDWFLKGIDVC